MNNLSKVLLSLALLVAVAMFFEKPNTNQFTKTQDNHIITHTLLSGITIEEVEYDSCLGALKCIKQNNINGFNNFYINTAPNILNNALSELNLTECSKWLNLECQNINPKVVRIDSVYGYTDDHGSMISCKNAQREKERITYVTFLFPSTHSSKLLTFEFSDKFSTDHFINWWAESI